jgi:hypothetical protein
LWLIVAGGVEVEFSDEFAGVFGDDADVVFADQDKDVGVGIGAAEADVVQPAVVAQGDGAIGVRRATTSRDTRRPLLLEE